MGEALTAADPMLARRLGLAVVYQDNSLVRELTVAENLLLGAMAAQRRSRGKRALGGKAPRSVMISAFRRTRWSAI